MLKISILQVLYFSVRGGAEVCSCVSWRYVGWSLQHAGFARLTRFLGLYCAGRDGWCFFEALLIDSYATECIFFY